MICDQPIVFSHFNQISACLNTSFSSSSVQVLSSSSSLEVDQFSRTFETEDDLDSFPQSLYQKIDDFFDEQGFYFICPSEACQSGSSHKCIQLSSISFEKSAAKNTSQLPSKLPSLLAHRRQKASETNSQDKSRL